MPRTVWEPDPRWKDDPQWNNPSHLRACAEEYHYERLRRTWIIPLYIYPASPTDGVLSLSFRDIFCRNAGRRLDKLTPDDCRIFCWKDCAIYGNLDVVRHSMTLLDFIYQRWFPQRAQDKDISDGSFFGKLMCFWDRTDCTLQEILRFHESLCKKLCELEKEIPDTMPIDPLRAWAYKDFPPEIAEYKLRETFPVVFMVVDSG